MLVPAAGLPVRKHNRLTLKFRRRYTGSGADRGQHILVRTVDISAGGALSREHGLPVGRDVIVVSFCGPIHERRKGMYASYSTGRWTDLDRLDLPSPYRDGARPPDGQKSIASRRRWTGNFLDR